MSFSNNILALVLLSAVGITISARTSYNSQTHVCCSGTVIDKGDAKEASCCGSISYNTTRSMCCGDQLLILPEVNSSRYECCYGNNSRAEMLFNRDTQDCCDGLAIERPDPEESYGCCSGKLYSYSSEICCGGEVADDGCGDNRCCGSNMVYDITTQICCEVFGNVGQDQGWLSNVSERTNNMTSCCGLKVYDYRYEACCNDVVMPKKVGIGEAVFAECCGSATYDTKKEGCCSHKTVYNKTTQICCDEVGHFIGLEHKVGNRTSNTTSCCGLEVYDYRQEACCNDTLIPKKTGIGIAVLAKCCGPETYDTANQFCCDKWGKINYNTYVITAHNLYNISNKLNVLSCCGTSLYNASEAFCCSDENDTVVPKPKDSGRNEDMVCCGGQLIVNTTTHMCVFDKIVSKDDNDCAYCNEPSFNPNTHVYCGINTFAIRNNTECCYGAMYDLDTQICCGSKVYDIRNGTECCSDAGAIYDPATQICCIDGIEEMTEEDLEANNDACCGLLDYDTDYETDLEERNANVTKKKLSTGLN